MWIVVWKIMWNMALISGGIWQGRIKRGGFVDGGRGRVLAHGRSMRENVIFDYCLADDPRQNLGQKREGSGQGFASFWQGFGKNDTVNFV